MYVFIISLNYEENMFQIYKKNNKKLRGVKMFSWHIFFMLAVLRFALVQFADGVALQCM